MLICVGNFRYIDYLKEEIVAEALTRNIPAFSRFLEIAALSNGEMLNFTFKLLISSSILFGGHVQDKSKNKAAAKTKTNSMNGKLSVVR